MKAHHAIRITKFAPRPALSSAVVAIAVAGLAGPVWAHSDLAQPSSQQSPQSSTMGQSSSVRFQRGSTKGQRSKQKSSTMGQPKTVKQAQQSTQRAGPQVSVKQPSPKVNVSQPKPTVTVHQRAPKVIVTQPTPTVTVNIPRPKVKVIERKPKVQVQTSQPNVRVQQAKPQVSIQRQQPSVQVQHAKPKVQVEQSGKANVQYQGSQKPKVVVHRNQAQVRVRKGRNQSQSARGQSQSGSSSLLMSRKGQTLVGQPLMGPKGQQVGKISDFVTNKQRNRLFAVIQLKGNSSKVVVVPLQQLQMKQGKLQSQQGMQKIKQDPTYKKGQYQPIELSVPLRQFKTQ
jgi:hypothetical protein